MHWPRAVRALAILAAPAAIAVSGWETFGPAGTRVNSVSAAGDADGRAYAAATILESSTSALYRTDDAGRTWTGLIEAGAGDAFSGIFADPRNAQRVFASAQRGQGATEIYRSDDRGENWGTILSLTARCVPSMVAGGAPDSLYLTCGTRFLRTIDAGNTWDEPATPFTENVRLTSGPGALYAYGPSRVFRSDNLGTTWVQGAAPPAACPSFLSLAVDPVDPQALLAGTGVIGAGGFQCGGVYRSSNRGTTWSSPGLTGVYVTDVTFDSDDSSRAYAAASFIAGILPPGGVYASGDGGRSFSSTRLPASGALEVAVSATGRLLYAATPLGVYQQTVRRTQTVVR